MKKTLASGTPASGPLDSGRPTTAARLATLALIAIFAISPAPSRPALAAACCSACGCATGPYVAQLHSETRGNINNHVSREFVEHQNWIVNDFWEGRVHPALRRMADQLTAAGTQQVKTLGTFEDANNQLNTQRELQKMEADARRRYQPSEEVCALASASGGLNVANTAARVETQVASAFEVAQDMRREGTLTAGTNEAAQATQWNTYLQKYCDPTDMGGQLKNICTAGDPEKMNKDVDISKTVDAAMNIPEGDEDFNALMLNLFPPMQIDSFTEDMLKNPKEASRRNMLAYRSIVAQRSVAKLPYTAIKGLKKEVDPDGQGVIAKESLKAMASAAFGVTPGTALPADVQKIMDETLGEKPSYYAQTEVLTKLLYRSPDFYTALYNKGNDVDNVVRQSVGMQALDLQQGRDTLETLLRLEKVAGVLLQKELETSEGRLIDAIGHSGVK